MAPKSYCKHEGCGSAFGLCHFRFLFGFDSRFAKKTWTCAEPLMTPRGRVVAQAPVVLSLSLSLPRRGKRAASRETAARSPQQEPGSVGKKSASGETTHSRASRQIYHASILREDASVQGARTPPGPGQTTVHLCKVRDHAKVSRAVPVDIVQWSFIRSQRVTRTWC